MNINDFLRSVARKLVLKNKEEVDIPVSTHQKLLDARSEPRDDIDRSFNQYLCQKKIYGGFIHLCSAAASCVLIIPKLFLSSPPSEKTSSDAVFVSENIPENVIPAVLREEMGSITPIKRYDLERFDKEDRRFFFQLWKRHPFALPFLFKCLLKIRLYSALMEKYSPKAIITCNEFSYTSSVLTLYCEEKGVEHIDVMHGEKILNARDSFFRFHRTFVWDEFYVRLFEKLRAEKGQFHVAVPPSLLFEKEGGEKTVDFTYYLQSQKGEELQTIVKMMKRLEGDGNKVAFRPHPRFTPMEELSEFLKGSDMEVENYREISIEDSILRTRNVISVFSTVLQQAFYNGVSIVIDDLSNPQKTKNLAEHEFVMLKHPHQKLSTILEEK